MNVAIAVVTLLIALVSYSVYIRDVLAGKTRPHGMTWIIWAALNGFIFFEQVTHDAGPGAWITGATAVANLVIFILSFKFGEKDVTFFDWICLLLVGVFFSIWVANSDATLAVLMAIAVFIIGLLPTVRKVYLGRSNETILTFFLNGLKFFLALLALQSFTIVTAAYPITLFIVNILFALYLVYLWKKRRSPTRRRKHVGAAR
ncbi:MAG: hypothetical protein WAO28_02200 [Candidatus Microsaccharimonas sp.]